MFTGIIEELGHVVAIENEGGNTHFKIKAKMASELKIDQSLAHDGCCLTVVPSREPKSLKIIHYVANRRGEI